MKLLLSKIFHSIAQVFSRVLLYIKHGKASVFACLFSFCLVFGGIYITASRTIAIKQIRYQMSHYITWLNELGLDIAYDKIEFNSIFFFPLVTIDNLQIYNIQGLNSWTLKFNQVNAYPNIFGAQKLRFSTNGSGKFIFNDFISDMSSKETFLDITRKENLFNSLIFHAEDIDIHDFAKIKNITYLIESIPQNNIISSINIPYLSSFFEIKDIDINGLINYPLSSHLNLLYTKADIIGRITPDESLLTTLETWLKEGGFIDIPSLIIQWEPLTLVGRGNINFNESFSPRINFNTSSKGILRLLQDLQDNNFLDSKNVFVANILLSNKAYKLNPEDQEMTVSTPVSYSDGKIAIENLTIKDFNK